MVNDILDFNVWTKPVPQGSFIARVVKGMAFVTPDNAGDLNRYRKLVETHAKQAMAKRYGQPTLFAKTVAMELELIFTIERPKSVKPGKRPMPVVKPDLDKLIRSIGDALTEAVYEDDSQIVSILARKRYGHEEGVRIIVRRAEEIAEAVELPLAMPEPEKIRTVFDF